MPLVGSSLLDLHHDVYLLFYFAFVTALLASCVRHNGIVVALSTRSCPPSSRA